MVRTLARTAVVLVLAAAVAAALYLAVVSHGQSLSDDDRPDARSAASYDHFRQRHGDAWDHRSSNRAEHGGREEASVGRGVVGSAGTALQIGVVGAVVVAVQRRRRRRQRRRRENG